jgi:hypothetical protein
VRQLRAPLAMPLPDDDGETTRRGLPVPHELRSVAAALCEPLLAGGQLPESRGLDLRTSPRHLR